MYINKKEDISYLVGILLIISDVSASYKTGTVECDKLIINQIIRTYIVSGHGDFDALERNYDELLKRVNNYIYTQLQRERRMQKESDMQSFRAIYDYLIKNYLHIVNLAKWDDTMSSSSNSLSAKELKIAKLLKQQGGKKSKKQPKKEILGKIICIHKIPNDRKEYVKHKGKLITIKKYKELIKVKSEK